MTIGLPVRPHYGSAISGRELGLIIGYEMDAQEGELINKEVTGAAGGSDGAITGAAYRINDPIHSNGLRFSNDAGVVTFTQVGDTHTEGTIAITVRPWALAGVQWIFRSVLGGGECAFVYFDGADLFTRFGDAAASDSSYNGIVGKSFRLLVKWTDVHVWVFVDGVQIDDYASDTTNDIATAYLGAQDGTFVDGLEGELSEFEFYRRLLPLGDILKDYADYRIRPWYEELLRSVWVSSADNVAGQLENSRWMINSINGTAFRVVDAPQLAGLSRTPNVKAIQCNGDGFIYIANQHLGLKATDPEAAFGTFEWYVRKDAASTLSFGFISSTTQINTMNGYVLRFEPDESVTLRRYTGGVSANTIFTTAAAAVPVDTWFKVTVERRYDGQFTVRVNDVLLVAAIGTNPGTDITHTAGSFWNADCDDGDSFSLVSQRWGSPP